MIVSDLFGEIFLHELPQCLFCGLFLHTPSIEAGGLAFTGIVSVGWEDWRAVRAADAFVALRMHIVPKEYVVVVTSGGSVPAPGRRKKEDENHL